MTSLSCSSPLVFSGESGAEGASEDGLPWCAADSSWSGSHHSSAPHSLLSFHRSLIWSLLAAKGQWTRRVTARRSALPMARCRNRGHDQKPDSDCRSNGELVAVRLPLFVRILLLYWPRGEMRLPPLRPNSATTVWAAHLVFVVILSIPRACTRQLFLWTPWLPLF